ncbi:MAG: putative selenium-dependent hydroxylase accessory protein YqeC [Oscillospiraceae bacterium]|nr:putative selenium-dependent hydroxylase accessory protein YqeC [Oscillospiraceae bacterium]
MALFSELLHIQPGITAVIGSGGKTALLSRLAAELSSCARVVLATSTRIYPPAHLPFFEQISQLTAPQAVCVGTRALRGKLAAPQQSFAELASIADYVLVEADGSANLPLKAHAAHEPVIPAQSNQVIAVVGASGFGKTIGEAAHRAQRYAFLAGASLDTIVTPQLAARVLDAEALHTRVLINQAELYPQESQTLAQMLRCAAVSLRKGEILCSY